MKKKTVFASMLLALCLIAGGCQALQFIFGGGGGKVTRDQALLPAMKATWPNVKKDVERGIADAVADGDATQAQAEAHRGQIGGVDAALVGKDAPLLKASWAPLKPLAERGIQDRVDDGEIGPGVAGSMIERVKNFDEAVRKY